MTREELKAALRTAADDYKRATNEVLARYVAGDVTERPERATIHAELRDDLLRVLTEDGVERWWDTPIPALGRLTPNDAVANGDINQVRALVASYLEPMGSS